MGDGTDPYKLMGVNPRAPARGLKKIRHRSNPNGSVDIDRSSDKCVECGKILLSWEIYDSKYCKECAEKIKSPENEKTTDFNSLNTDSASANPATRVHALESLYQIKDDKAILILIEALKNEDSDIRWKAARHLGNIKDKNVVDALIESLEDPDFRVRTNAAWSLGEIGNKKAINYLNKALKDENKFVKNNAKEALSKIENTKKKELDV